VAGLGALTLTYARPLAALFDSLFASSARAGAPPASRRCSRARCAGAELACCWWRCCWCRSRGRAAADFLQDGPVLTFEKIKPKLENMNPVEA
jgi:flagellar biosynthesis protein FlhB